MLAFAYRCELRGGRNLPVAELQAHHALRAPGTVGLRAAVSQIADDRAVFDELAPHGDGLAVVQDLSGNAAAEVEFPRRTRHRVDRAVYLVGAQWNRVSSPRFAAGDVDDHHLVTESASNGYPQQPPHDRIGGVQQRHRRM